MQDTFCLSVNPKFSFGTERGLPFLNTLPANMKSADEGKFCRFVSVFRVVSEVTRAAVWAVHCSDAVGCVDTWFMRLQRCQEPVHFLKVKCKLLLINADFKQE